jgi:acyl-CoA synthetase (AMP-forming)/AMP-acid ligase II
MHLAKSGTIVDDCVRHAHANPDEIVFRFLDDGESESAQLTYDQLLRRAIEIARHLLSTVAPGSRVLLLFQPGLEFVTALYGCFFARVIAVPCYPPRPRRKALEDLRAIANDSGSALALASGPLAAALPDWMREHLGWSTLPVHATEHIVGDGASLGGMPTIEAGDVALLQYTSGSTGAPKGVVIAHENLVSNLEMIRRTFNQDENSRGVLWLPPYHDMGLIGGVLLPVYVGGPIALMPPAAFVQKPVRWLQAVTKYAATTSGGPNFAYELCSSRIDDAQLAELDLSCWNTAFNGAEPVRRSTLARFARRFERCGFRSSSFLPCYGMAEATLLIAAASRGSWSQRAPSAALPDELTTPPEDVISCGRAAPGTELLVVDPQSREALREGQVGELWVHSPSVGRGYWGNVERTHQGFGGALAGVSDRRYLRTGDLGFVDDGELYVTGRIKDLIIVRGKNYYPQDIEQVVERSHAVLRPGHGAAFGVAFEGEESLVVVQEVERDALRTLDADEVLASIQREVAVAFNVRPHAIVLVKPAKIPKTSSGKIMRFKCRSEFLDGTLQAVASVVLERRLD